MNRNESILNRKSYFCLELFHRKRSRNGEYLKTLIVLILTFNFLVEGKAQQEPLFSSYMLGRTVTNPGFLGRDDAMNALFVNRVMFAGFGEGKPETSVFGLEAPIEMLGFRSGVGALVMSDKVGFANTVNVDLSYTYRQKFEIGQLGVGLTIGFNNFSIEPEWYVPENIEAYSVSLSDPTFTTQMSDISLGIGLGAVYETPQYYIGLSVSKLKRNEISTTTETPTRFYYDVPHYYITGGYNIKMPNPLVELRPSFMLRSDLSSYVLDANGVFYFGEKYLAGGGIRITPRNFAALTFLGGLELMNGLRLNYGLDINTGLMMLYGLTSHEVTLTYSFNLDMKRNQKYKSIRYL